VEASVIVRQIFSGITLASCLFLIAAIVLFQ